MKELFNKESLLNNHNYLSTKYKNELYRQICQYIKDNYLGFCTKSDIAKKLDISERCLVQILSGDFNGSLEDLISLSLKIGKVPVIKFVNKDKYKI